MKNRLITPNFTSGSLGFQTDGDEFWIYGTSEGLLRLSELIREIASKKPPAHLHLEDRELLTLESQRGAIAVCEAGGLLVRRGQ